MIKRWIFKYALGKIGAMMGSSNFQSLLAQKINEKVDIPGLDERKEAQLIEVVIETTFSLMTAYFVKK